MSADNKGKKILILIAASCFIGIILLMLLFHDSSETPQQTQLPSISPPEEPIVTPVTTLEVTEAKWIELGSTLPRYGNEVESRLFDDGVVSGKASPDGTYAAFLKDSVSLVVGLIDGGRFATKAEFPFSEGTNLYTYTWISPSQILFVEKEDNFWKLDRIYIIDVEQNRKDYLIGSFPITGRLNLNEEIAVYSDGKTYVFKDNNGNYWSLVLTISN